MFANREACTVIDSSGGSEALRDIRNWFDTLWNEARQPDLAQAKLIFDARSRYRLMPRPGRDVDAEATYWALKTTSGKTGKQHWPSFLAESVIAVGWADIPVDPSKVDDDKLRAAIAKTYPDDDVSGAAKKIRRFVDLKGGDIVVLCRGYAANQSKNVHIYGLARVTGAFRDDKKTRWDWRFKHNAVIQPSTWTSRSPSWRRRWESTRCAKRFTVCRKTALIAWLRC